MRKFRAARVQFDNHVVSGIAYGIAQTAVVCVVPPDIISITACPKNYYPRTIHFHSSYTSTYIITIFLSLIYSKGGAAYLFRLTTTAGLGILSRPTMQYSTHYQNIEFHPLPYFLDSWVFLRLVRFMSSLRIQK